ncbi:M28 family metallopeptidase [Clostridium ganghwense]|uniref:M28 family metallopeptidase n=1 Tax=Clostridium ganghwense TaxID=312089 RepID=A0ABT4CMX9_9CLOT|nr:M28 family metallopeptidase [Clostridium ganghwense]MCY6369793.1 M28 family metallopeptidase [Clostridium ganghwense]
MKRLFNQFITCIFLIVFFLSLNTYRTIHTFNVSTVIDTIDYLSSDHFQGRLTGTLENKEVEEYIKLQFIENDLKPFLGEYEQTFKLTFPNRINNKDPYLNVTDKQGNIIRNFSYAKDYKEDMLNFKNNKFSFNNKNPLIKSSDKSIQVKQNSDYFLFYTPSDNALQFRSSFVCPDPLSMCIMVSQDTLSNIKKYLSEGYNINCFIPFTNKETTARNIMGYIEGNDKTSNPIIISAHFDHLGTDLANNIYRGALDNASGTAFMLEMIKHLKSLGTPEKSILFIGFNAEEFGCIGSTKFVGKYKNYIKDSKVFNFDMIGSDRGVPLCIMGGENDTFKTDLMRSASNTCTDEHVHFNYLFQDASDHKAFRENNINAITFCDNDTSKIHTPKDTLEFISPSAIERCYNVASKEIVKYAFDNNPIIIYYKQGLLISIAGIILIILACSKKKYH